jgi:hypothetical protein
MWICSLWLTLVKLMSNFICVNGSLRFDRVQLHFVRICYSLPVYQRLTSGPAYSPLTQDILSHALPACRLGEGAMPHCDVLAGKNRHHQLGSTSAMPISRAPSSPVDERCAGCKIETAGEQNVPAMGTLLRFDTPLFFWTRLRARTQTADHRRGGARGASAAATETWIVPSSRSPILRRPPDQYKRRDGVRRRSDLWRPYDHRRCADLAIRIA